MIWQPQWKRRSFDRPTAAPRRRPRFAPRFEGLEGRSLLTTVFGTPVTLSGSSVDMVKGVTDSQGYTDVVGTFQGTVDFDPNNSSPASSATLDSGSTPNMFVARYDSNQDLVWVRSFADDEAAGGTQVTPTDFSVDPDSGGIFIVGSYSGAPMNFDPGSGSDVLTPTAHSTDGFVVELDATGAPIPGMALSLGTTGTTQALTISTPDLEDVNVAPYIYIGGSFQGDADFNPGGTGGTLTGPSPTTTDTSGFLLKLSSDLAFQWAQGGEGSGFTRITDVTVDDYVDPIAVGNATGPGAQYEVWDRTGAPIAQAQFAAGGIDPASSLHVTYDQDENVYIAGQVVGSAINFNPTAGGTPADLTTDAGSADVFLAKFDATTQGLDWVRQLASAGTDTATGLDSNEPSGIIHLAGTDDGPATFGPDAATDPVVLPYMNYDGAIEEGYAIQVDKSGNFVEGFGVGGSGASSITYATYNPSDGLTIVGNFAGNSGLLGSTPQDGATLSGTGTTSGFFDVTTSDTGPISGSSPSNPTPPTSLPVVTTTPIFTPTPIIEPAPLTPVTPTATTPTTVSTPTSTPTGPLAYVPPIVVDPTVMATTTTRARRAITTVDLAVAGDVAPSFYLPDFTVKAHGRFSPKRFTQTIKVKSVTYDAAQHMIELHLARPHRGALQVTVAAGAVRTIAGGSLESSYRTVVG